jgi:hypothetical protein
MKFKLYTVHTNGYFTKLILLGRLLSNAEAVFALGIIYMPWNKLKTYCIRISTNNWI